MGRSQSPIASHSAASQPKPRALQYRSLLFFLFHLLTLPAACRLLHRFQPLNAGATYGAVARGNKVDLSYDSDAQDGSPEDGLAVASTTCDDPAPQPLAV